MKKIEHILLITCLVLYVSTKSLRILGVIHSGFLNDHLTDLVCMPLVLALIHWLIRKIPSYRNLQRVPIIAILGLTVYWSWYFEFYLPSHKIQHTGDWMDVIMYFSGAFLFLLSQRMGKRVLVH